MTTKPATTPALAATSSAQDRYTLAPTEYMHQALAAVKLAPTANPATDVAMWRALATELAKYLDVRAPRPAWNDAGEFFPDAATIVAGTEWEKPSQWIAREDCSPGYYLTQVCAREFGSLTPSAPDQYKAEAWRNVAEVLAVYMDELVTDSSSKENPA